MLASIPAVSEVPPFPADADALLNELATNFSVEDAQEVRRGQRKKIIVW